VTLLRRLVLAGLVLAATLASGAALADSGTIDFESSVDFKAIRTFALREGSIRSLKPEVDNRLFRQRMNDSIRAVLAKKGLKEVATQPDVVVTFHFSDADVSQVDRLPATRIPDAPGMRGFVIPGSGPRQVLYTEGSLVIDMYDASDTLIWRGTYRDREQSGPRLSRNLSEDARRLLSRFPPRKR